MRRPLSRVELAFAVGFSVGAAATALLTAALALGVF